mmetsp:Transcript_8702/g.14270  ORF Transcript_8702/g.14270 Transcript_8702/m.14270 type:complete len:179 (-) Transcript_8702:445-981(-)
MMSTIHPHGGLNPRTLTTTIAQSKHRVSNKKLLLKSCRHRRLLYDKLICNSLSKSLFLLLFLKSAVLIVRVLPTGCIVPRSRKGQRHGCLNPTLALMTAVHPPSKKETTLAKTIDQSEHRLLKDTHRGLIRNLKDAQSKLRSVTKTHGAMILNPSIAQSQHLLPKETSGDVIRNLSIA